MATVNPLISVLQVTGRGHPSDYVISDFTAALQAHGVRPRRSVPSKAGTVLERLGRWHSPIHRAVTIVPMMGARFDLAYVASLRGQPVLVCWDVWEPHLDMWASRIQRLSPAMVFTTSQQSADALTSLVACPVRCLPEALSASDYDPGADLALRTIDVLELGRRHQAWHEAVAPSIAEWGRTHRFERLKGEVVFPTRRELIRGLADSKISVCFPSSTTHPERSGKTTTMTHRYLESIASRCLVLGECPPELPDLLGFDPVVPVDWTDPAGQVADVLMNIADYQSQVDRAAAVLPSVADWSVRAGQLLDQVRRLETHA